MKFMMMHKHDEHTEAGLPPPLELVQKMGAFIGEHARAGRFLGGEGLGASKTRTRLTFKGGECTIKRGPYGGGHELPANALVLKVENVDQALGWAERYGKILGDGEIEVGKINEAWDIGLMPAPANPPLRVLLIDKADAASEGQGRSKEQKAALSRLRNEMTKAGVLTSTLALAPSSKGKRLDFKKNDLRIIDGPFAESKELIGGFSVMELSGFDEAIALARTYAEILGGTLELDVRLIDES
jgi:hypothetical protein